MKTTNDCVFNVDHLELAKEVVLVVQNLLEDFKREFHGIEMVFTREQAAEYLQISIPTLDKLVQDGILDRYQVPGRSIIRFKRSDLEYCLKKVNFKGNKGK